MKREICIVGLAVLWATAALAQTKNKSTKKNTPSAAIQAAPPVQLPEGMTSLTAWGQYRAKRGTGSVNNSFTITDPTVRTLHMRAQGAPVPSDSKDILGVPKIVYGVGNGQILFRSRGTTTSGTGTGSASVGTGSSTGPVGIHGYINGVNGKSPGAGPIMDGIIVTDLNDRRNYVPAPRTQPAKQKRTEQ